MFCSNRTSLFLLLVGKNVSLVVPHYILENTCRASSAENYLVPHHKQHECHPPDPHAPTAALPQKSPIGEAEPVRNHFQKRVTAFLAICRNKDVANGVFSHPQTNVQQRRNMPISSRTRQGANLNFPETLARYSMCAWSSSVY